MSKNFRSSFINLLCCRYSRWYLCEPTNGLRNRCNTESYTKKFNLKYRQTKYRTGSSIVSQLSRLNPTKRMSNMDEGTALSSLPRLTTDLISRCDQKNLADNQGKLSTDTHSACHITIGTRTNTCNQPNRQRKHEGSSLTVVYCS